MAGKFELKTAASGQTHFNLLAANGQVILSSEMYETKAAAENGIQSVKTNSTDDSRFDRRQSDSGKAYFALKAANGQDIGRSQMYETTESMENGIESVKTNAPDAEIVDSTSA